ncbi:MAG: 16S rRNA (cytosine(1402)-N(4))-methyltransferase [Candidatus Andersenbacteria bacterium]|nr:16S rRNA (cytosine(1402)-N(4))-methyltransferase [Candidatus Andersenbacteria bacterium]
MTPSHTPVLTQPVLDLFSPQEGTHLLDATVGLGGHAEMYLAAAADTQVLGLDIDDSALAQAKKRLQQYGSRVRLTAASYAYLDEVAGNETFDHILFDLGVGSHQLSDSERGISFRSTGPLAMKFSTVGQVQPKLPPSSLPSVKWLEQRLGYAPDAPELIAGIPEEELADILRQYGEERYARRIASALKRMSPNLPAAAVADEIIAAVPGRYEGGRIHPATRTFQALRIVVNRELESLEMGLPKAVSHLKTHGRLVVISFHSLEDRIVKRFLKETKSLTTLTKKPMVATQEEKARNPRSHTNT